METGVTGGRGTLRETRRDSREREPVRETQEGEGAG